jgi:hypothetical protein
LTPASAPNQGQPNASTQQFSNNNKPQLPAKQPVQGGHPQPYNTNNSQPPPHQAPQGSNYPQQYSSNKPQPPLPTSDVYYGNQQGGQPGRRLTPQSQPPTNHGYSTSPPPSHGLQSPPTVNHANRPPSGQARPHASPRLPPSPSPPGNVDPALWPLFKAVDKSGKSQHTPYPRT